MGDTSQHTFQDQENRTMSVIQVNIPQDIAIQGRVHWNFYDE